MASDSSAVMHLNGSELDLIWSIPFIGMLLSIATFPVFAPHFWHKHFGKIAYFWAACIIIPLALQFGVSLAGYEILHVLFYEYIPFVVLLLALYTVSGGIRIKGYLASTPGTNTAILALGTFLASWMGTTGAAMLLIRPLLRANENRQHKIHTVVFFIFLVANIGGSLTPLGDPPLFLGFLMGVSFFWPTVNMFLPMVFISVILLALYYVMDRIWYNIEPENTHVYDDHGQKLGIEGKWNFLLLAGILGAVIMSGVWNPGVYFDIHHVQVKLQNITRDLILISITIASLVITKQQVRVDNGFSWFPIVEVAKIFIGIFLTMVPVITILKAGTSGALGDVVRLVSTPEGEPINALYFWVTGVLSSFLDNAPTYVVFFNIAGGDAQILMNEYNQTLLAISAGAVFMGAMSYIGNAPNFMVRSIAQDRGIPMPSFAGYMLWSVLILGPVFVLATLVFF